MYEIVRLWAFNSLFVCSAAWVLIELYGATPFSLQAVNL